MDENCHMYSNESRVICRGLQTVMCLCNWISLGNSKLSCIFPVGMEKRPRTYYSIQDPEIPYANHFEDPPNLVVAKVLVCGVPRIDPKKEKWNSRCNVILILVKNLIVYKLCSPSPRVFASSKNNQESRRWVPIYPCRDVKKSSSCGFVTNDLRTGRLVANGKQFIDDPENLQGRIVNWGVETG